MNLNRRVEMLARVLVCLVLWFAGSGAGHAQCARLGPESKRSALLSQPGETYTFVVRGSRKVLDLAREMHRPTAGFPDSASIDGIRAVAVATRVRALETLCLDPELEQIWYLHPAVDDVYVKTLLGVDHAIRTVPPPGVINLSLGPPIDALPLPGDPEEPMNVATKAAADRGLLAVFAIGNIPDFGQSPGPNPWCEPEWVVCVGAAHTDGQTLWKGSVVGERDVPETWPDVVAKGVDVISLWPSNIVKPVVRKRRDEADPVFRQTVPEDSWDLYTMMSGTSQAAAQVSRGASQVMYFVRMLAEDREVQPGGRAFALDVPSDHPSVAPGASRLTGEIVRRTSDSVEVEYRLVEPWKLVKQLLMDTAIPMPAYGQHEVGHGFVYPDYLDQQFGAYGVVDRSILPIKVQ